MQIEKPFYEMPDFSKIRLLFLDVDGVLNSRKTVVFTGKWPCYWDEYQVKYKKEHIRYGEAFDKYCVQLVNQVCKVTETFIVISSSWKNCYSDLNMILDIFEEMGIDPKYIIGRTDDLKTHVRRGAQIKRFMGMFQGSEADRKYMVEKGLLLPSYAVPGEVKVDSYVIVDDLDEEEVFVDQEPNLVKTDDYEGLTLRDTLSIGQKLTYDIAFGVKDLQGKRKKWSTFL
jgi:hypothetical protein